MVNDQQQRFFKDNGYLLLEGFISDDWLARLRAASDLFIDKSREISTSTRMLDLEPDHLPGAPRLRRLTSPPDHHETFREFSLSGPAAEIAIALLGDPVRYHHSKLNYKWSDGGEAVKWHQDIQFWPHTDFSPLTIGVYLDDVDDDMGPMGVLPGSHMGTLYNQYDTDGNWAGAMRPEDVEKIDLDSMVWLKGPAGSVTVHNCCMIHGSAPNLSSRARPLLLQTYSAADSYPVSGIGANGSLGQFGGQVIGNQASQQLTIEGRTMQGAPDWSRKGTPTIFGSQQKETTE